MSKTAATHKREGGLPASRLTLEGCEYLYRQEGQLLPHRVTTGSPEEEEKMKGVDYLLKQMIKGVGVVTIVTAGGGGESGVVVTQMEGKREVGGSTPTLDVFASTP